MRSDELGALIQRADLNQRLTRALEIKGHKSPIRTLDSVVAPVVMVEDLTRQAEWTTPTERRLASTADIAAVVGEAGLLVVQNPISSGVVAVMTKISAHGLNGADPFVFGLCDPAHIPANPANLFFCDRRVVGAPTLRAWSGTDAVLRIVNPYLYFYGSNAITCPFFEVDEIVVQPGEAFGISSLTQNHGVRLNIWLQEIPV